MVHCQSLFLNAICGLLYWLLPIWVLLTVLLLNYSTQLWQGCWQHFPLFMSWVTAIRAVTWSSTTLTSGADGPLVVAITVSCAGFYGHSSAMLLCPSNQALPHQSYTAAHGPWHSLDKWNCSGHSCFRFFSPPQYVDGSDAANMEKLHILEMHRF